MWSGAMMSIPSVPDGQERRNRLRPNPKGLDRCIVCELPTESPKTVHLGEGGSMLLARGERSPNGQNEDDEGGQGYFPVGQECAKRIPSEYLS